MNDPLAILSGGRVAPLDSHNDGSLRIVSPSCGVPGRGKVWDGPRFGGGTEGMLRLGPRQKAGKQPSILKEKATAPRKKAQKQLIT